MSYHAKKSPSGSKRWKTCPGSIREISAAGLPSEDNQYSKEGREAHSLLEECLSTRNYQDAATPAQIGKGDHHAADAVTDALIYLKPFLRQGNVVIVERSVYIPIIKDTGTPDIMIWDPTNRFLHCFDYKHGQGFAVDAKENSQGRLYLSGYRALPAIKGKIKKMFFHIMQPRAYHYDGPMRCEEITPAEMDLWEAEWQGYADACDAPDAPLVPSPDGCRWCAVRAQCPALRQQAVEAARMDFKDFLDPAVPVPVPQLPTVGEQLTRAMQAIPLIEAWIKNVKAEVLKRTMAGEATGFKMVEGRANRQWIDQDAVIDYLQKCEYPPALDAIAPRKLVGLKEMEKLLHPDIRDETMAAIAHKPPGKPTLVPNDDPRPPINNAKIDFAEEIDDG